MGGRGSGRYSYSLRLTTEDACPFDIRRLARAGVLTPGRYFEWEWTCGALSKGYVPARALEGSVEVYRAAVASQRLYIDQTPCHFGGSRPWWFCPRCGRRAAVVYLGAPHVGCRRCLSLAYRSWREAAGERALRRTQHIRCRLGGSANLAAPFPAKPPGMRRSTYESMRHVADAAAARWLEDLAHRLGSGPRSAVLERAADGNAAA